jgi:nitrite reductase (NADH) small subunit
VPRYHVVGPADELAPGTVTIVYPSSVPAGIGVFNVAGAFYALKNTCPHMGAPLCRGLVTGTARERGDGVLGVEWEREGEIVRCPWHHWEFEIKTGRTVFPSRNRVRSFAVSVESPEVAERLRAGVETYPVRVEEALVVVQLA